MKIFLGGIKMEANSFSPVHADCGTFKKGQWLEGEQIKKHRLEAVDICGVYDYFDTVEDVEIIPGFFASSIPCGPIKNGEYEYMAGILLEKLESAGPVDGVILIQHGACQSESIDDCEGYLMERIRGIVGEDVPIVSSFDLHTCLTKKMMQYLDGANGYYTYPHVDIGETSYRAARSLDKLLRNGIKPCKLHKTIPLVLPIATPDTKGGPFTWAMDRFKQVIEMSGVLSGALFITQPWLDTPQLGTHLCLFFEDEAMRGEFEAAADEILGYLWDNRKLFYPDFPDAYEAIKQCETLETPVCIVDLGDVINSGSVGDSTEALRSLLRARPGKPSCVMLLDPKTVQAARRLGAGTKAEFMIGGSDDEGYNRRIPVEAQVVMIDPEPFPCIDPTEKGNIVNAGTRVLLRAGNINIIVFERPCTTHDINMLISMGLDPSEMGIIFQKAAQSFKPSFTGVMKSYIYANTPGYSDNDITRLPFKNITRPLYPFDNM